jgi:hypothetical protein
MRLRSWLAVTALIASAGLGFPSTAIAQSPSGTKNFSTPPAAPNYFSNESGPITRTPAPLPFPPPAGIGAVREDETPAVRPEPTIAHQPQRRIITVVTSRTRGRVRHARTTVSDRRKVVVARGQSSKPAQVAVARGRSSKPAQVAARVRRPPAARLAHAEPHGARSRPAAGKGQRAGRG